uniref:Uncharacterized protein n=1 Tax=Odontella aurita TaxID=265563 RepID=A0A7S4JVV7_9STRA|mmetsp:Transcript_5544/g.16108  ORF Transcript_5544/g.16108 Transcript_5544/m.16108 type:complete len:443 (+) Transcript_5544:201-1529(+)
MADVLPKDEKERGSETAGAPAEAESRRHDGGGDHEDQPAGTDEGDESGGTEEPAAVEAVTDDGGGSAEGPTEKEKAPPPNSSEPPVDDSSAGAAEAGVEMAGKRLGRKDVEEIPPGMIESATSLADMEKSPGPAAAGKDGDGGGIKHRGEKRPAAAEATPPTPPPTEKPPPPNQISRQGGSGGTGPEPANLGAAGDAARKKAGKQRRAQRQKQQLQGAAAGPAGARGVQPQPRRVQQRHAVPRGQQQPVQPENRAPGQQQQPPQQQVPPPQHYHYPKMAAPTVGAPSTVVQMNLRDVLLADRARHLRRQHQQQEQEFRTLSRYQQLQFSPLTAAAPATAALLPRQYPLPPQPQQQQQEIDPFDANLDAIFGPTTGEYSSSSSSSSSSRHYDASEESAGSSSGIDDSLHYVDGCQVMEDDMGALDAGNTDFDDFLRLSDIAGV